MAYLGWAWNPSELPRKKSRYFGKKLTKWMQIRAAVFKRYGYKCMKCDSIDNLEIDHIKPISKFPKLAMDFDNLQILCRPCNKAKWNYHSTDYRESSAARDLDLKLKRELSRHI